ncbi:ABC transporter permease [Pseudogracilibacillus sp. SO30301A]|uniref:ABC transporter permease n=1 Tax=Pseudogracilibacillus sp. SO30301A TaxID=3098291 RepID=UPI00300DD5DC
MDTLVNTLQYMLDDWQSILTLTIEHLYMSLSGVLFAIVIGVPIALIMTRNEKLAVTVQTTVSMIQTIPSLALLLLIMIVFGLGYTTTIIALVCYSFLPIIMNTYVGLQNVDEHLIEAGEGMGMTPLQLLLQVKFPLALPTMMVGFRVAMVICIGIATIATFVGAGGLGQLIFRGILSTDDVKILAGSIPAALLAISIDFLLKFAEGRSTFYLKRVSSE